LISPGEFKQYVPPEICEHQLCRIRDPAARLPLQAVIAILPEKAVSGKLLSVHQFFYDILKAIQGAVFMKEKFTSSLSGKLWWKPFLAFLALYLAIFIPIELAGLRNDDSAGLFSILSTFLFLFVMYGLLFVLRAVFTIILADLAVPAISFRGKPFVFTGKTGEYVKLTITRYLLSCISLGFYGPWFTRAATAYLARNTEYDGEKACFSGTGGKLLKYYLLGLFLPLTVWVAFLVAGSILAARSDPGPDVLSVLFPLFTIIIVFLVFTPFLFLYTRWYLNLGWKDLRVTLKARFWPSCGFIAGQILLTLITIGIYWPALCIRTYRYFAGQTILSAEGKERGRFGFDGRTGRGFGLLWGQTLLAIITLGIYSPWAYAKCLNFFVNETYIEDVAEPVQEIPAPVK
jgi:Predicted membrane protein